MRALSRIVSSWRNPVSLADGAPYGKSIMRSVFVLIERRGEV
jgi:hypothetical protein